MASKDFTPGDLVWAKMKSYPPWPAKIENPPSIKPPKTKDSHYVFFFGSENYAWIPDKHITPHSESVLKTFGNKKTAAFQKAVDDFVSFAKCPDKTKYDKSQTHEDVRTQVMKDLTSIGQKDERSVLSDKSSTLVKRSFSDANGSMNVDISSKVSKNHFSSYFGEDDIDAHSIKFGFMGLGHMGKAIVKNIIGSGLDITVWNRHSFKYSSIEQAYKAESPADLVMKCDVIFCCVSDSEVSKALIFGERGILKGLEDAERSSRSRKAFVEMTSIDSQSSVEISEAINMKQGLYLEAPLCGTNKDAEDGTLIVVASGDRRVFTRCEPCFHAIVREAFYLSCEVGYAAKINLLLRMLPGTLCVVIAEFMVLAEKLKIPKEHFLKLVHLGALNCDIIMQQMDKMQHPSFSVHTAIQRLHTDVNLSLQSADYFSQPMPVTAAANEVLKLVRCLGFSEMDPAAMYKTLSQ